MNMNVSTSKIVPIPPFTLHEFYLNDFWDLTEHPSFENLTESQKRLVENRKHDLDFSVSQHPIIKNEIKYYCQNMIEVDKKKVSYFTTLVGGVTLTIEFTNEIYLENEGSILDKEYDFVVEEFTQYLKRNGYKSHVTAKNALSEDMEQKEYKHPTPYLRFFKGLYQFLKGKFENKENQKKDIFQHDKWDIRDLPFKAKGFEPSRPRYTISFENITQDKIKTIAKRFTIERLKVRKYSTCIDDLKGINLLSKFLNDQYTEIESLDQLDRKIIEDFLGFINLDVNLKPRTKSSRIGSVKTFFETCMLYGWEGSPKQTLLLTDDVKKKYKVLPKFYDDSVLYQINKHLEHLPVQIARMIFVIQNVGMRVSELCSLKIDCVKPDTEGDFLLVYFQEKTHEWNRVPIKKDVALAVREATKYSKEQFGENVKYVFMQDEERPISKDTFSYHMNQLTKKFDIRDSNGDLVRIKSHHFRGTLATKYANMGMSINLIRILLGQKSLGAIRHYVEILEETISDSMQDVLQFQDQMIQNIGKTDNVVRINEEDQMEIPLPNGRCGKPLSSGKCTHANACYTCAMFKPDPNNIDLFKYQLAEAKSNVEMAKINGFERVLQVNEDLVEALEKIIASIEKRGA